MTSFLDTIATEIYKGFKGKLRTVTLRRESATSVDSLGDPVSPTATTYTCDGFRATYSAFYKNQSQIPDGDIKISITAGSLAAIPQRQDQVKIEGDWYQVREVMTDPATALWDLQCFPIKDPT